MSVKSEDELRKLTRKYKYSRGSHMPHKMWEESLRVGALSVDYQAKFLPNTMVGFAPCIDAWHCVAPVPKESGIARRDTLQAFVKAPRLSSVSMNLGLC